MHGLNAQEQKAVGLEVIPDVAKPFDVVGSRREVRPEQEVVVVIVEDDPDAAARDRVSKVVPRSIRATSASTSSASVPT